MPAANRQLMRIHSDNPVRATIAGTYLREMRDSMREIWLQLRQGGYLVLVAANNEICGRNFKTTQYLCRIAEEIGFPNHSSTDRRYSFPWAHDQTQQNG